MSTALLTTLRRFGPPRRAGQVEAVLVALPVPAPPAAARVPALVVPEFRGVEIRQHLRHPAARGGRVAAAGGDGEWAEVDGDDTARADAN